ncbi:DEAD/DEAH box helicase [Gandjariella thermophila]|uniref:Helicase HelZ n=1 Tax=Gandjariella thermophila TaxID=1931992 RepID=A0A4D4J6K0_9PSEU|nr:DEAD/DEAH box helicase [Gandjariella thermophila]GDY29563.1 helicase HelZ [Gandjariella thermophila]
MLALHGLATADGGLALWAEDSRLPQRGTGRRPRESTPPGREPAARRGPDGHPFAAPAEALLDLLPVDRGTAQPDGLPVLLPSRGATPIASPELVRDPLAAGPPPRGRPRLRPWLVPVVRLAPATALAVLADGLTGAEDCRAGASVRYLARVAALARELVAAGKVLPDVVAGPAARWRAALYGPDAGRFAALRDAMPPACRAERVEPGSLDGRGPEDVLRTALDALVDADVRARLAERRVRLAPSRRGRATAADATVTAWLAALVGEPRFAGNPEQVRRLAERLADWRASGVREAPVRTCFRLETPEQVDAEDGGWRLRFLLQAVDEPSVLVPAAQVWRETDGVLYRWVGDPQELLLADLGRASRLFPDLDAALRERHPVELALDTEGAYRFLTHAAALDQAGFGVLLPSGWRPSADLGLRLTTSTRGAAGVVSRADGAGLSAVVDYRWDLAVGDEPLTEAELAELAAAKVPLVRLRGRWVQVDQRRLAAGLAFLKRARSGQMTAGDVLLRAVHPDGDDLPMPVTEVAGDGWLGDLLSGRVDRHLEPVEPPATFAAQLRPYQRRGLAWLAFLDGLGLGACLADDMGLGKTVQLLALEALARSDGRRPPTLLVCPMSVVGNWQREAERFTPTLSVHVHHGSDRLTGEELAATAGRHDLVITTYALAARDAAALAAVHWDRVVLDEAQNIKNAAAKQSQVVRRLTARHRVALTGTPVENRLAELWSIMDFVNPGMLGSVSTFRARYAVPVERYGDEDAAARLRRVTGPFVLRRLKTDPAIIDDLPDKIEMKQLCNLTAEQASLYRAVVDDMLARIERSEGIERRGLVLATMSKLKQVCNHPAQFLGDGSRVAGRSGKLARLEEIVEEALADGDKVLCFSQFAEFAGMLVPHLSARFDTEVLFLHGGTPKKARDEAVRRFQSAEGPSIFLLSLKAGGTGLTLTAANQVVHLDRWWNPAVEDQATDRAFRIGQRRDVQVRKFLCIGTLEEKIDRMIEEKKALAQMVVGAGESWLTELSTRELRDLVMLSEEAVGE